jgi:hypothetical protein
VPVMVTAAPTAPVVIDKLVILGVTVKGFPLLATPETVTTTFPVVAELGTVTPMLVPLQDVTDAVVPLNATVLVPWVVPKFVPVIVTAVPTGPKLTDNVVIVGAAWAPGARNNSESTARIVTDFQLATRISTCLQTSRLKHTDHGRYSQLDSAKKRSWVGVQNCDGFNTRGPRRGEAAPTAVVGVRL